MSKFWDIAIGTCIFAWLILCTIYSFNLFGVKCIEYRPASFMSDGIPITRGSIVTELSSIIFAAFAVLSFWKAYYKSKVAGKVCLLFIDLIAIEIIYLFTQDYYKPFDGVKMIYIGCAIAVFVLQLYLIKYHAVIKKQLFNFALSLILIFKK